MKTINEKYRKITKDTMGNSLLVSSLHKATNLQGAVHALDPRTGSPLFGKLILYCLYIYYSVTEFQYPILKRYCFVCLTEQHFQNTTVVLQHKSGFVIFLLLTSFLQYEGHKNTIIDLFFSVMDPVCLHYYTMF